MKAELLVKYMLSRLGCTHPFRISRILLLAEYEFREKYGRRLSQDLTFKGESFGFYIEELGLLINELERQGCIERIPEKKCIIYRCEEPSIDEPAKSVIDSIIDRVKGLDDRELNKIVISHPLYHEIVQSE